MQTRALLIAAVILLAIFGLAVAWWVAGKAGIVTFDEISRLLAIARATHWAPALVLAAFLIGAAVAFPVNLLILATAAVFGPWLGFLYSSLGAFSSAFLLYFVGAHLGKTVLARLFGPRLQRVLEAARKQGFWVVVAFRVVPVAPGTVINLGLGASGIRTGDFAMGTFIGMTPGLLLVSIMGDRLVALVTNPTLDGVGVLLLCMVAYLAFVVVARAFLSRRRYRR
jgi:phospholipase D1/2